MRPPVLGLGSSSFTRRAKTRHDCHEPITAQKGVGFSEYGWEQKHYRASYGPQEEALWLPVTRRICDDLPLATAERQKLERTSGTLSQCSQSSRSQEKKKKKKVSEENYFSRAGLLNSLNATKVF
ncbi:hypothetical protein AOLI_G00142820 [Acnodon oligacanthus]